MKFEDIKVEATDLRFEKKPSVAYNTESILIEAKRHNLIMEQESIKQTQLLLKILAKL